MTFATEPTVLDVLTDGGADALPGIGDIRADTLDAVEACHQSLFGPEAHTPLLGSPARRCLAYEVAESQGSAPLSQYYGSRTLASGELEFAPCADTPASDDLDAAIDYAVAAAVRPGDIRQSHITTLAQAGLDERDIVVVSQIQAFVSYQLRLVAGMRAIRQEAGLPVTGPAEPETPVALPAAPPRTPDEEDFGFTLAAVEWLPRIAPVVLEDATEEQQDALGAKGNGVGAYTLTLAHDPASLKTRSTLYNKVMYAPGGADRVDREYAALRVSIINGCRLCASVHARRLAQLSKDEAWVQQLLDADPAVVRSERQQAIDALATALTLTPGSLDVTLITALRAQGLDALEVFDIVNVIAMFAWANRLMQTLGTHRLAAPDAAA